MEKERGNLELEERGKPYKAHQPHDKLARYCLSDLLAAAAFFKYLLPEKITKHLDWSRLEPCKEIFVNKELKLSEIDLVFRVPYKSIKNRVEWVYIPVEHYSTQYPNLGNRHLQNQVKIEMEMYQLIRGKKIPPLVIPVALIQLNKPWKGDCTYQDRYKTFYKEHDDLKLSQPIQIIELFKIHYAQFKGPPMLVVSLRLLRAAALRELMSEEVWDEDLLAQLSKEHLAVVFNYIYNNQYVDKKEFVARVERVENPIAEEKIMTYTEYLKKEGRKEGLFAGKIQMLLTQLTRKFGKLDPIQRERIEGATPRELRRWTLRILDAQRIEEVFK